MAKMPYLSGRFNQPSLWRRGLMIVLLAAVASVLGGYPYLSHPDRVSKLAGGLLAGMAGADVQIESARFGLNGVITLHGVEMHIKDMPGPEGVLFDAEQVLIQHNLLSLIRGVFRARTLRFINPTLHLTEIVEADRFNFQHLQERRRTGADGQLPGQLPEIILRHGRVLYAEVDRGQFNELGSVYLGGNLHPSSDKPGTYYFKLRQENPDQATGDSGPVLNGRLNLEKFLVTAQIEHFTLGAAQRSILPYRLRNWWDQLEPMGSLASVRFGYNPDPEIGFNAQLELLNVAITLPYGERDSRMTDVSGRFSIVNKTITIADLEGEIEDLQYVINGRVRGFSRDAPFHLSARTEPFAIPEEPRYLLALPTGVQKQFKRLTPSGTFQAQATIQRSEPGGPLTYDGSVRISNAKLLYHQFRYPLEGVHGQLRFNDEQIELIALTGRGVTGARVVINGVIAPPQDDAAVHMVVTATNAPVDAVLYDAIPQKYRPILDLFFNKEAHQMLLETGLIQTRSDQIQHTKELESLRAQKRSRPTDRDEAQTLGPPIDQRIAALQAAVEVPVFELGGLTTVIAQSSRGYGPGHKIQTTLSLDVSGVNALIKHWPYPLRARTGRLLIKPNEVVVDGIELEGTSGASGSVAGTIAIVNNEQERRLDPQLDLVITNMPCDRILYASVPPAQGRRLNDLSLSGTLTGTGQIYRNDDKGRIDYRIEATLDQGRIQPNGGRFEVEQINGHMTIGSDHIRFDSLEGQHGLARFELSGGTQWDQSGQHLDLALAVTAMDLDKSVLDLLPPDDPVTERLVGLFDAHEPTGKLDADLTYRLGPQHDAEYRLDLRFDQLNFRFHDQPVALADITGGFVVTPHHVGLDNWGGSFGPGGFVASGSVGVGQHRYVDVTFDAQSKHLDPVIRAVLPEAVLGVIDGLELNGAFEIHRADLVYRPMEDQPVFNFRGKAHLTNATATVGVAIDQMVGDLDIQATRRADSPWPRMDLKFDAQQLLAAGRLTSPLSLHIASDDQPDRLTIHDLRGSCYGGTLLGSGQIELEGQGLYQMNLVLQDVALNPFLNPESEPGPPPASTSASSRDHLTDTQQDRFTGVLAASLTIEGSLHHPTKRRGRGNLEIRNAQLYEVPLSLALIQILNLSLPASRSFDRATASYLINDDWVLFDTICFEAPTIEVVGTGLMRYSTLELDLDLHTRNPVGPDLGLLSDLLGVFKNELLSIRVTGTLDDPKPNATSFQGIKRSWREAFGAGRSFDQTRPSTGVGRGLQ